jgi:hypothetical protein
MIGVAKSPPMLPAFVMLKDPSLKSSGRSLPARARGADVGQVGGELQQALEVRVLDDRHDQPVRRVHRDAEGRTYFF